MSVPRFSRAFSPLELLVSNALKPFVELRPVWPNFQSPFAGVSRAARVFERLLPFGHEVSEISRRGVEDAVRTAVAVPVNRQLTDWEVERIADSVVAKVQPKRRRKAKAVTEVYYEVVEPEPCQHSKPEVVEPAEGRKGRAAAELPSETMLKALKLLQKYGLRKYKSTRLATVVEHWVQRAEKVELAEDFDEEKSATRKWVREHSPVKPQGNRKNEGQLPALSTLDQVINSLEPIYQELRESMRSKLAPKSEVGKSA
jgi:hypothetical protein